MPESIEPTRVGRNRTGLKASPGDTPEMLDSMLTDGSSEPPEALTALRLQAIQEAEPLGTVPPPAGIKGMAKTGAQLLTGHRPQAFLDKLGERLAFERGGARLYDAVLTKFQAYAEELDGVSEAEVRKIRDDEAAHANLLSRSIEMMGGDPTAQTPCADLVGMQTMGLLQTAADPRTTLAQTLSSALAAELIDNVAWETLIALAEKMGTDAMVEEFRQALLDEQDHLLKIRTWYERLTLESGRLM